MDYFENCSSLTGRADSRVLRTSDLVVLCYSTGINTIVPHVNDFAYSEKINYIARNVNKRTSYVVSEINFNSNNCISNRFVTQRSRTHDK